MSGRRAKRVAPKDSLPPSAEPLDAVHIACTSNPATKGFSLKLPDRTNAVHVVRQEALRWTYMLRSRKRWVNDRRARERNEGQARAALNEIGIEPTKLAKLGESDIVVIRIPWTGNEEMHWESRIFPWEYVLSAATRQIRLERSEDGRTVQLTVIREIQRQTKGKPPKTKSAVSMSPSASSPPTVLFVELVPSEIEQHWQVSNERDRLRQVLPKETKWILLRHPTPEQLLNAVRKRRPTLVHFAGLDSHQGLRELRKHFGATAKVDVDRNLCWLAALGGDVDETSEESLRELLVDKVVADPKLMVDGVLLRNDEGLPLLVRAHDLAKLLKHAGHSMWLVTMNIWNSAARIAPLMVAEGATAAALGFQDAFDDSLADFVHSTLYRLLIEKGWNLPIAFEEMWRKVRELPESVDATGISLWTGAPVLPLHSAPMAIQHALRQDNADVRVEIKPYPELNYAVLHNAQPLFEKFVLECDQPATDKFVDIEIEVHMGTEKASFERRVVMEKIRICLAKDIHVPLTAGVARSVHEAINSSVTVRVRQSHNILHRETHRLRLLPVDQWRDNRRDGRWLPSFVQPRDPMVQRAIEQAQRYNCVLRDNPNAGFEGYQSALFNDEDSLSNVDRQVEAVWAALLHEWRLAYINPPPAYSGALDSQRLRSPSMIHATRCGTCIDLALLFAACLELIDIHPVIFLLEGHALPGWWRHSDFRDEYAEMSDSRLSDVVDISAEQSSVASAQLVSWHTGKASHAEIQRWIRQRKLVPIETVRLTENCGFVEAIEAGISALSSRDDFDSMLEIITARNEQVTPLPMLGGSP